MNIKTQFTLNICNCWIGCVLFQIFNIWYWPPTSRDFGIVWLGCFYIALCVAKCFTISSITCSSQHPLNMGQQFVKSSEQTTDKSDFKMSGVSLVELCLSSRITPPGGTISCPHQGPGIRNMASEITINSRMLMGWEKKAAEWCLCAGRNCLKAFFTTD